ncbi:hypothetical protein BH739_04635 [Enterococcus casseliflavus]|nr:hypothetical protein BH739_04635 [Enterococcus casseliflavus]
MKRRTQRLLIQTILFGCVAFYLFHRGTLLFMQLEGDWLERLTVTANQLWPILQNEPINFQFTRESLRIGLFSFVGCLFIGIYHLFNERNFRVGEEYGSSRWGDASDSQPFADKKPEENILLTATEKLTMATHIKKQKFERNKNVLLIGGAGSQKTRGYVKPNLMQMHASYVVTESKNLLPHETGKMFHEAGYRVKIFDLVNRENCHYFNPMAYIDREDDVLMIVKNLLKNTDDRVQKTGDPFWDKAETALYCAIISYLMEEGLPSEQTFPMVARMVREGRIDSEEEGLVSPLDILFQEFKEEHPDHFATKQYDTFKLATFKTARSILICASVRLMPFDIPSIAKLVSKDTLELDTLGDEKTILYICLPDTNETFNFLAAMLYDVLFEKLIYKADNMYRGRLPVHVRCLLDEMANIGQIPDFDKKVTTIRSREISVNIILQSLSQLKNLYKNTWENIMGSCDSFVYLGGMEETSHKLISQLVGKETIDIQKINQNYGQQGGYSKSVDKSGRDLIMTDEVANLDNDVCILKIRGVPAFKSQKYELEKHPRYKELSDANSDNWYEFKREQSAVEQFLEHVKTMESYDFSELNDLAS